MVHETHDDKTHSKQLPRELGAPEFVNGWQRCALTVGFT